MSGMSLSFDQIMAPVGAAAFLAEHEGREPLHLKGAADKFAHVMNWRRLNDLLGQATIWSQPSLQLVLDKEPVPAAAYCAPAPGRDGGQVLRPDPDRVQAYLQQGATLIANDIDHLTPELTEFSQTMEQALGGKVQGNLYLSSRRRQGFGAHFDTHDVFAVHVEGTKTWRIYTGRADDPIAHPAFKTLGRDHHERAKGELRQEVHMEPGDLLYLPRGQYHDALADEGGAVHIAFGITYPIGLDVLSLLFERVVQQPAFRANLPRAAGGAALGARLRELADDLGRTLASEPMLQQVRRFQASYHYPRHGYDLPDLLARPLDPKFRVRAQGVRLVEHGGRVGLLREGTKAAVEVPADVRGAVGWVIGRPRFTRSELLAAFPAMAENQVERLLQDLGKMRLIEAT